MKEGCGWQNGMKLSLLTSHASVCNTTMVGFESGDTVEREDAEQLHYAPPHWSYIGYYGMGRYWILLSHSSSTHCRYFKQPALHLRGFEPVVLPYLQGLATAIFQQDNTRLHVAFIVQRFFVNHQIELLP
ncbi:transposable element Tcb1 transposase [Trichonephila clavipes]|nr:transposable element Tcb1 transposase [Trichonephila clavipes]